MIREALEEVIAEVNYLAARSEMIREAQNIIELKELPGITSRLIYLRRELLTYYNDPKYKPRKFQLLKGGL